MSGVNKVILVGYIGQKPELRYTSSGVPVANMRLATTERWGKDESGNTKEHTEWHNVVAWRKLAEICAQWLDKGSQVYMEGRLRTTSYEGKDGEKRWKTEIQIDDMTMLGGRGNRSESGGGGYSDEAGGGNGGGGGGGSKPFPQAQGANGRKGAATVEAPEVINLDNLDDDQFF